jgi:hypothetical protein
LGCGRRKFTRMYEPHKCNGQFRKHKFPAGFKAIKLQEINDYAELRKQELPGQWLSEL